MRYNSDISRMIHQHAAELYDVGAIDKTTMRKFDQACLTPIVPLTPQEIREIRQKENFSQTVFATYLNVSKNRVSEWERGVKKPSGTALKLLTLVRHKGIAAIA
ncbi:DNA-binding transcriptional regulator [Testudinibacter sp. TR-2022]|uniref:helix-turn-helix domain-containing protein n=1 Tax=Testudinibacter sp. TR-2022 TaxID=2585029 RepID=UPI00111A8A88|nr:DNA-binding transcriptional regulator [Testudinibacter sp. TR-2022]TNH04782.1 DNA-binding transcriptional regulator [Pasteurellaceae bacterium Phil31]TNH07311.1 DNA-binding transcriptional regulator [Pasteurellaceae bacterium Phil11]TNH10244.1 DNA-binding transcriptional regulator [Testudinibacter sp. TR-2022]TNH12127.1 DNA-binding transcriptional regulator [Testudinibacter sp. TR-2022]TNH12767.1 DNA-binding transcriptional regulator [Testudinibacter sp. TR-2022]